MLDSETSTVTHSGNASTTTPYVVTFSFLNPEHLQVIVTDSDGASTLLKAEVDYTLTGIYSSDGARYSGATLTTASAYPSTSLLTIQRVTPILQPTELKRTGRFSAETLEIAIDRQAMIAQETRRDVSPSVPYVETLDASLVVNNPAHGFAVLPLAAASGSGLAVKNGDSLSGKPAIDTDFSTLPTVTALANDDLVPVYASDEEATISVANLRPEMFASEFYRSFFMLARDMVPGGSGYPIVETVGYATASEDLLSFYINHPTKAYLRIVLPNDYSSGVLKLRLHQRNPVIPSVAYEYNVLWKVRASKATTGPGGMDISSDYLDAVIQGGYNGENEYLQSEPIDIGSGWSANDPILIEIYRDAFNVNDRFSYEAQIVAVEFQYPAQAVTAAWS